MLCTLQTNKMIIQWGSRKLSNIILQGKTFHLLTTLSLFRFDDERDERKIKCEKISNKKLLLDF